MKTPISKLKALCFIIGFLVVSSCDPVYERQLCPSYVGCYLKLEGIRLSTTPENSRSLLIKRSDDTPWITYDLNDSGENLKVYEDLCRKHNDLKYNQYRLVARNQAYDEVVYNDCDFTSVTIRADRAFDDTHAAGESLNDVARFLSWSPAKFIDSGYSAYYHYDSRGVSDAFNTVMRIFIYRDYFLEETAATCYPVDKMVNDLTAEDLVLLGHDGPGLIGILYFEKTPTQPGDYTFTLSMTTDTGKTFTDSAVMSF